MREKSSVVLVCEGFEPNERLRLLCARAGSSNLPSARRCAPSALCPSRRVSTPPLTASTSIVRNFCFRHQGYCEAFLWYRPGGSSSSAGFGSAVEGQIARFSCQPKAVLLPAQAGSTTAYHLRWVTRHASPTRPARSVEAL